MKIEKRAFLQYFIMLLAYSTATFFACYLGVIQTIFNADVTYMTSLIAALFTISCLFIGYATWNFEKNITKAIAGSTMARTAAYVVTLVGLLGTVIGLSIQVKALGSLDISNDQNITAFIGILGSSIGTAMFSTMCGIVAAIGITAMNSNLEYFIDAENVSQTPT